MFIVAILGQPRNDIPIRPVDLQGMSVLVINMVLWSQSDKGTCNEIGHIITYVDRHLIHMHALLNPELRDEDVKRSIEDTDNLSLAYDGPVPLRKI